MCICQCVKSISFEGEWKIIQIPTEESDPHIPHITEIVLLNTKYSHALIAWFAFIGYFTHTDTHTDRVHSLHLEFYWIEVTHCPVHIKCTQTFWGICYLTCSSSYAGHSNNCPLTLLPFTPMQEEPFTIAFTFAGLQSQSLWSMSKERERRDKLVSTTAMNKCL